MRKTYESLLKEYAKKLSEDTLEYLYVRFKQNLCGDRAEIADMISRDKNMDRLLAGATDSDEWFNLIDLVGEYVIVEYDKRTGVVEKIAS